MLFPHFEIKPGAIKQKQTFNSAFQAFLKYVDAENMYPGLYQNAMPIVNDTNNTAVMIYLK